MGIVAVRYTCIVSPGNSRFVQKNLRLSSYVVPGKNQEFLLGSAPHTLACCPVMHRVAPRVPSRGMHAKRAQPPPPPSKPASRPSPQSSRAAPSPPPEAPRAPPPPVPEAKFDSAPAAAEQAATVSPHSAVLAKVRNTAKKPPPFGAL